MGLLDAPSISRAQADVRYVSSGEPGSLVTSPDTVSQSGLWTVNRAPTMTPPRKIITRFASGHAWTSGADDLTTYLYGDRSYKGTTNGSGGSLYLGSPTFGTAQDWSTSIIRAVIRVSDSTKISTFQCNITQGAGNQVTANLPVNFVSGEWSVVTMPRSLFSTTSGTANWANVTGMNFRVQDNSTGAQTINFNAVELIPDLASTYPAGVMILEADDGYAGQFTNLLQVTSARGIPVTFNAIADRFTGASPLAGVGPDALQKVQDKYGWQISCHSYAGAVHSGTGVTAAQFEQDFQRQKQWLHANGLHSGVDHYAHCPASGSGTPNPEGALTRALYRSFRSARINAGAYETATPADPMRLRSILFTGQTNSQLQTNIGLCAGAGGALVLTLHDVITGATNGTSNSLPAPGTTNLATVLDYALGLGMVFRTRADWLDGR